MKKITTTLLLLMVFSLGYSQDPATGPTVPIARDAASVLSLYNGIASPVAPQYTNVVPGGVAFNSFGGTTIADPDPVLADGNTVKKYTNHLFSGISTGDSDTGGALDATAMTKLHIDVYSPNFTSFKVKLEGPSGPAPELEVPGTKVKNAWNSYDIDLTPYKAAGVNFASLKWVVIVTNDKSGETLYIDNVYFYAGELAAPTCTDGVQNGDETGIDCGGSCPTVCLVQINLPVTFEDAAVDYFVTDFEGTASTLVVDPTNPDNKVIQTIKGVGAKFYGGTSIGRNRLGFSSAIPFTATNKKMYVRVWSPAAGIPVQLKVEDALDGAKSAEVISNTTVANGWQTMEFDFSTPRVGSIVLTNSYKLATIFFKFVIDAPDNAADETYFFDDVTFGAPLSTNQFEASKELKMYPNPASNRLTIEAKSAIEKVSIFNILGQQMLEKNPKSQSSTLDISNLQNGVYIVKTTIEGKVASSRFVKN